MQHLSIDFLQNKSFEDKKNDNPCNESKLSLNQSCVNNSRRTKEESFKIRVEQLRHKKKDLTEHQLEVLGLTFAKFQDYVKREEPPTMSQQFQLARDINMFANDDYEAITVRVEALVEVMTNFYEYECTPKIMEMVEKINYRQNTYFSFNTLCKIVSLRRDSYQELEEYSKQIGALVSTQYSSEIEHMY